MKILNFSTLLSFTFGLSIGRHQPTDSYWCGSDPKDYIYRDNSGDGSGGGSGDGSGDGIEVQWELPVPESTSRSKNSNRKCYMMASGYQ